MSIQAYAGEFTVSPIPLEMSMNYCSHSCEYCFANLNQPNRKLDVKTTINQIKNCHKGKGLASYLLAKKYPVLLSNRVDPFATTNYRQAISFIEMLTENGNKIAFQTKGGEGVDEALSIIDYTANWYISISFWNDNYRKLIEPGATTIQQRIELVEKLIAKGHNVSVGINPLVEEWLPLEDFEHLYSKLKSLGVTDYWMQPLHLNAKQIKQMSERGKKNIGEDLLISSSRRHLNYSYIDYLDDIITSDGGNVFSGHSTPKASKYFDKIRELYPNSNPVFSDFIKHCFEKMPKGGLVRFSDFYEFMKMPYYEMPFSECDGYAYRIARNVYKEHLEKPFKTLKSVLEFYWTYPEISKSPFSNELFEPAFVIDKKDNRAVTDKKDKTWIGYFNAGDLFKKNLFEKDELSSLPQLKDIS